MQFWRNSTPQILQDKKKWTLIFYNAYKIDNLIYIVIFTSHVFRTQGYFYRSFLAPQFDLQFESQAVLQFLTPHKNKLSILKFNYPIFVDHFQALSCSMGLFCFVFRHWIKNINVRKKTDPLPLCSFTKHPLLKISLH